MKSSEFKVRAIVVEKEKIYSQLLRSDKDTFYAFFVKTMLKFDGGLLNGAKVVIDGSGDRAYRQQLAKYLRQHCAEGAIKEVKFANSSGDRLVQLADMCAAAIARSYKTEELCAPLASYVSPKSKTFGRLSKGVASHPPRSAIAEHAHHPATVRQGRTT